MKVHIFTPAIMECVNAFVANVFIYDKKDKTDFEFFSFANIRGRFGRMLHHFFGRAELGPILTGYPASHRSPARKATVYARPSSKPSNATICALALCLTEQSRLTRSPSGSRTMTTTTPTQGSRCACLASSSELGNPPNVRSNRYNTTGSQASIRNRSVAESRRSRKRSPTRHACSRIPGANRVDPHHVLAAASNL